MIMFSVNKKLLQMKLIYFLTFAGLCPLTSFGSTFAKQLGFSTSAVGFVYCVSIVLSIFARLIFGYVADKFQKHKSLLISFIFMCACSILLLALFPQTKIREVFFSSDENATKFTICFPDGMKTDTFLRDGKLCEMYCDGKSFSVLFEKNKGLNENLSSYSHVIDVDKSFKKLNNVCFTGHRESVNIFAIEEQKNENLSVCSMMACNSESKSIINEFSKPIFWIYFCVYAMYLITNFVICVFVDTVCFQVLNKEGGRFGNQRMFASMGWGGAALISGILTDFFSKGEYSKNYLPACILSFIFLTATGILLIFFEMPSIEKTTNIDFKTLETVLWNRNSANFACWCFLIGVFSAVVWQYAFWIIEDISNNEELMWDKSLQGVMVVVNTILGDVPTYYFFDYMISKLGYIHCMTLTLLLNAVRLFAYSVLNRPIWALLISMLDGFTFGTSYATIASYANIISTSDSKTTIQAIFNSIFDGIGTSFGGLCFGFAYNWYGGAFSFRLCSFIALFSTFAHVLVHRYSKKNNF